MGDAVFDTPSCRTRCQRQRAGVAREVAALTGKKRAARARRPGDRPTIKWQVSIRSPTRPSNPRFIYGLCAASIRRHKPLLGYSAGCAGRMLPINGVVDATNYMSGGR